MKKWLIIMLGIICAVNLLACSEEEVNSSEAEVAAVDAEIEAIFKTLEKEPKKETKKETMGSKPKETISQTLETEESTETDNVPTEGVPAEYGHLFRTGDFDENLVWTSYDEEYSELVEALFTLCEQNAIGSVMIATDEDVIFAGGFNEKEADGETRINPFTTYEIATLTQSFTAAAILQQIQEGNLKASDTLDQFFPDYPHGSKITIDNLLHMDSGIPDYINESMRFFKGRTAEGYEAFMNGQMTDEEILSYFYKSELVFEPGKRSRSSITNYYLLALILEQVTGLTYEDYMQAYIFDVCGLENTTCTETGNLTSVPQENKGYMAMGRVCRGAGDMHSNVCDILMWNRELMAARIIDEEHLDYMTEARNGYACGWAEMGEDTVGQYGSTDGYLSVNMIFQREEENLYFIMMIPNERMWGQPGMVLDVLESYLE